MKKIISFICAFVLLLGLTVPALAADFTDVPTGAWYAEDVAWCREHGIMSGTGSATFSPNTFMSRAMLAAVLYRAAGSPAVTGQADFSDVPAGAYYNSAAKWADDHNYINGYGNRVFGSNDPVTRQDMVTILWRYAGSPAVAAADFADESSISPYAAPAVDWARENKIVSGVGGNRFDPKGTASRAQVAAILHRYLTQTAPAPSPSPSPNSKVLVAYFSRPGENYNVGTVSEGNTAKLAKEIASQTGGDIFEIKPVHPYPSDYREMLAIAQQEAAEDARPEIAGTVENMAGYDTVYIGYPIWNGDLPKIVVNFLESYDFTGKTVYPFCTHEGSGLAGTVDTISSLIGGTVEIGLAVRGSVAQNDRDETARLVTDWLGESGSDQQPTEKEVGEFDLESGTVLLNNGIEMPILGIGCFRLSSAQAENSVYWALRDGYRLIDTARIYGNEDGVGRGIQRAIDEGFVTREEIFVTTKMWTSDYSNGTAAIDASLQRLGLDYIDLMILHHSQPSNDVAAYQAMEQAVADGKLRSIGLSNYYEPEDFDRLVNATTIKPALIQNETHPYHQSTVMKEHIAQYGTVMESWFPLGGRGNTQTLFNDETISSIAASHGKTSAQVILRWHLQAGNIAIPGSSNEAHIQENFEIFDFALTDEEMARMTAIDKNQRFADY